MATSIDNFEDLSDLVDSSETDSLTEKFNKAANHLKSLVSNLDNQMLLTLYGYYKQGLEGPCNTGKPSWYDMKAKSKWEAWNKLGQMPQADAKTLYVELVMKLDPSFDPKSDKKESWVSVSVLQNEVDKKESDKNLVDYVKEGNCREIQRILEMSNGEVNQIDEDGLGLIHWAADRGSKDVLEVLLKFGANVDLQDSDGQTALHYASSCGHINCIKFLLSNNAKKDILDNEELSPHSVSSDESVRALLK